jgi:thiamine kinase
MIGAVLLQHVPGCENGDAPYSQELIHAGKVNRSFLVRTRRGRFVVRLNESASVDSGLDREREVLLHNLAASAGIAPHIIYVSGDRTCLVTEYVDGRLWTSHYFSRMRDLRSLGQRLRTLHALAAPALPRFDLLAAAKRYADFIVRHEPSDATRLASLLDRAGEAIAASGSAERAACLIHNDLHHGNVLTADRIYFIDWEYANVGDPLVDLACVASYYPRAMAHADLLLEASGLAERGVDAARLEKLSQAFTTLTYLWYRARRVTKPASSSDHQLEGTLLRRLLSGA